MGAGERPAQRGKGNKKWMREDKCWTFKDSTLKVKAAQGLFKSSAAVGKVSSSCVDRMPAQQRDILKGHTDSEGSRYSRPLPRIATGDARSRR